MTTLTLASNSHVALVASGNRLAYVNVTTDTALLAANWNDDWSVAQARLDARNARLQAIAQTSTKVTKLDDPRMKFNGEMVTIQELQYRRSKGMQDHWLGRAMVDGTWLYVDIWPEQVAILKDAGYGIGDFRPIARWVDVSYTVILKWESNMLKIAEAISAGRMVA